MSTENKTSGGNEVKRVVSGSLPLAEIFDMLNKAHKELAKCSISQDEYSPISWSLVDAKKRLSVLLSSNDH